MDAYEDCSRSYIAYTKMTVIHPSGPGLKPSTTARSWLISVRQLTAVLLCLCFASVHIMNSNMGMAIVCMVNSTMHNSTVENTYHGTLDWSPTVQGYIFSAFNVGLLFMLATGWFADKLNAKYMLTASVLLATAANIIIPLGAVNSFAFALLGRIMVGVADALLQPTVNSLLTRWFPSSERSYALGLATSGRQLGTLLIMPTAGLLCAQTEFLGGWPSIFYVSSMTGVVFIALWLVFGADKPSKHWFISKAEVDFIASSNAPEQMSEKRKHRKVPWARLLTSGPVWAAVVSLVCHEFPLMTMIMFLPSYLKDVLMYESTKNGIISALPTACLLFSKLASSYLNTWLQMHTALKRTTIVKILNSIASLGLGSFLLAATFLDYSRAWLAVVFLCCSMASAGLHTPGCQTALVSVAPAFSGTITGLTFFFVACSGIANPIITKWIVQYGYQSEWNLVFYISAAVALLPLIVFNLWGSADVQWWAQGSSKTSKQDEKVQQKIATMA